MDWFPWYFTIYEQDTMHLNPYQDGCYRRLIDHYMKTRAPLPDNDAALARIIGDSLENWEKNAARIVRAFFKPKNGNLYHKFCDKILDEQDSRSKSRSKSAKIAAEKRWKKNEINQEVKCDMNANGMRDACETHQKNDHSHATGQDRTIQDINNIDNTLNNTSAKKSKNKSDFVLPDFIPKNEWELYKKHRGKKFTPDAQKLALGKLESWHRDGYNIKNILETSVMNGWSGLFLPKDAQNLSKKTGVNQNGNFTQTTIRKDQRNKPVSFDQFQSLCNPELS